MNARERLKEALNLRRHEERAAEQSAARKRDLQTRLRAERFVEAPRQSAPPPVEESPPEKKKINASPGDQREAFPQPPKPLKVVETPARRTERRVTSGDRDEPRRSTPQNRRNETPVTPDNGRQNQPSRQPARAQIHEAAQSNFEARRNVAPPPMRRVQPSAGKESAAASRRPALHKAPEREARAGTNVRKHERTPVLKEERPAPAAAKRPLSPNRIAHRESLRKQSLARPTEDQARRKHKIPDLPSRADSPANANRQRGPSPAGESRTKLRAKLRTGGRLEPPPRLLFPSSSPEPIRKSRTRAPEHIETKLTPSRLPEAGIRDSNPRRHEEAPVKPARPIARRKISAASRDARPPRSRHVRSIASAARAEKFRFPARIRAAPRILPHPPAHVSQMLRAHTTRLTPIAAGLTQQGSAPATAAVPDPIFEAVATPIGIYPVLTPPLPALNTQGAFIVGPQHAAVALRGVNVTGFDAAASIQTIAADLELDDVSLAVLRRLWGLNLVRIPLQALTIVSGNGTLSAGDVLAALDSLVAKLAAAGMYALLAIQAPSAAANQTPPPVPQPDANTVAALQALATHFATDTGVLYEVFATPSPLGADWGQNAQILIGTIRAQNSAAMVFVNTGNGGVDYAQFPLLFPTGEPIFNLVYTIAAGAGSEPAPEEGALAGLAENYPVSATIWLDDPSGATPYVADVFGRYGIHWAASNWNADPLLVANAGAHDFSPSSWGLTVQRAATYPIRPLLQPISDTDFEPPPEPDE